MAVAARKRAPSTARDMVLSLIVVGGAIGVFVLLLPRSPHAKVATVAYLPAAQALAKDSPLPVVVPDPLPRAWQSSYVRIGSEPDSLHIGFVLSEKRFARLDESAKPDPAFFRAAYVPAKPAAASTNPAERPPAGFTVRRSGTHVALVRQLDGGGVLTISDGGTKSGASLAELVSLAASLRQLPG